MAALNELDQHWSCGSNVVVGISRRQKGGVGIVFVQPKGEVASLTALRRGPDLLLTDLGGPVACLQCIQLEIAEW